MIKRTNTPYISKFLADVEEKRSSGYAKEHTYRSLFENLMNLYGENIAVINDGKRIECGAPDICVLRKNMPFGYLECKDVDVNINNLYGKELEQLDRYKKALPNLILTNCLDWHYYRNGEKVKSVSIGRLSEKIEPFPNNFDELSVILMEFMDFESSKISEPVELAKKMAGKASLIKEVLKNSLEQDIFEENVESDIIGQFEAFKRNLVPDISIEEFADTYAETITYGMFAARLNENSDMSFNRVNALFLIPNTNPFLRYMFNYIAGHTLDDRLVWIIDGLAEIFRTCDLSKIMEGFKKLTGHSDPFIHFYETFLSQYNEKKRKSCGVYYTPLPVVQFIVHAIDNILQSEFGLVDGLADFSKVTIDFETGQRKQTKKGRFTKDKKQHTIPKDVHRVQILDPCTGTGTFLAEVAKTIAPKFNQTGMALWSDYVEEHLIPRLHGFELMMAPYAMCHMKLSMILDELKYEPENPKRFSVYLTDSLKEGEQSEQTFEFQEFLAREAKEANTIKRDLPIMCVLGNPPYLGESGKTKGWIGDLLDDYRKEPGSQVKLKDMPKWLNDIYVRFIRLASHFVEDKENRIGEGVIGLITNHSYLDSITFRGMRWHLLKTFDKIWILDLHGNVMKKDQSEIQEKDENVFDIQQGVAIIIAVKNNKNKNKYADLMRGDLYGSRQSKFDWLESGKLDNSKFRKIESREPYFPFIEWDYDLFDEYQQGFSLDDFMPVNSSGIVTARDNFTIDEDRSELWKRIQRFVQLDPEKARENFSLGKDSSDWTVARAQSDVKNNFDKSNLVPITYRPFDNRWTFYTGKKAGFINGPRTRTMNHLLFDENVGLVFSKQVGNETGPPVNVFITNSIFDNRGVYTNRGISQVAPLYIYPSNGDFLGEPSVNFDPELHKKIIKLVKKSNRGQPDNWAILDYIYGKLFCQSYLDKYDRFLRIGFPRVPWPKNANEFWKLSDKGKALRELHLSISQAKGSDIYNYLGKGDNLIKNPKFENKRIWINKEQYFENVTEEIWDLYIGGYQPAQKWLQDRKGNKLNTSGYRHFQSILEILAKTISIMDNE